MGFGDGLDISLILLKFHIAVETLLPRVIDICVPLAFHFRPLNRLAEVFTCRCYLNNSACNTLLYCGTYGKSYASAINRTM